MEQIKEIQAYLCERIAAIWNELLIQVSWLAEGGWSKVERYNLKSMFDFGSKTSVCETVKRPWSGVYRGPTAGKIRCLAMDVIYM